MRFLPRGETLCVLAPAKINLSLKILARREDGYHDLRTLMVSVKLYDLLQFSPADRNHLSLICRADSASGTPLPTDDRNLVVKAARLLQAETGCELGATISLWKRIPSEAGMGGGSSDAAATLVGLNRFWNLGLSASNLHELAARLGSDINFFIDSPRAALCSGRGEKVQELSLRQLHAVIIKPPGGLSTAKVFQQWSQDKGAGQPLNSEDARSEEQPAVSLLESSLGSSCNRDLQQHLVNDLEAPARKWNQEIDFLLSRLQRQDVIGSGMTGSGSACFALCRTAQHARTIAGRCRNWRLGSVFVASSGV